MASNSKEKAKTWPYPRHPHFVSEMRSAAAEWFARHGHDTRTRTPYILAQHGDWPYNIIMPQVVDYIRRDRNQREAVKQGFPLHSYIHHGLSSQAMVFNLLGPLIVSGDLGLLDPVFSAQGVEWPKGALTACFEYEDRDVFNEDSGQPTSIDVAIQAGSAPFLFIEAKFTENGFGGCSVFASGDCDGRMPIHDLSTCYLHYIGRRYWELMCKHGLLEGPLAGNCTCILATYYQFYRELLFALELGGSFALLVDERNPAFQAEGADGGRRGLMPFLTSLLPASLQSRVTYVTIQQVVDAIERSGRHDEWIGEFRKKYGM